jgi:hypothetical protein
MICAPVGHCELEAKEKGRLATALQVVQLFSYLLSSSGRIGM